MTPELLETYMRQAWRRLAPNSLEVPAPSGFWPDVGRMAVLLAVADATGEEINLSLFPRLDPAQRRPEWAESFKPPPTNPRPTQTSRAKTKAENTAALLARLQGAALS